MWLRIRLCRIIRALHLNCSEVIYALYIIKLNLQFTNTEPSLVGLSHSYITFPHSTFLDGMMVRCLSNSLFPMGYGLHEA